jgi:hypothetical protein
MSRRIYLVAAAAGLCTLSLLAAGLSREAQLWWKHVERLAADSMEGRAAGSAGYDKAAAYVAERFKELGLQPAFSGSFYQEVAFVSSTLDETQSAVVLISRQGRRQLDFGDEVILRPIETGSVEADMVFVGYGLKIPEAGIDEFQGLDLRGKVAVYVSGAPASIPGPLAAHSRSQAEQWRAMKEAGAIGAVSLTHPRKIDLPWERMALARSLPSFKLADPALDETAGMRLRLSVSPRAASLFLEGSGHSLQQILDLAEKGAPLPRFALPLRIQAQAVVRKEKLQSSNVGALRAGADPKVANEQVVLSAHLDHLGIGPAIRGDSIYNGAMDNASGVATLLEVGRLLRQRPLKRSVLFLAVTGEEKGLLGSRFFAARHPARQRLAANLNLDMFLPLFPLRALTVYGLEESDLGDWAQEVARAQGIAAVGDDEPQLNRFIRSDQYSFIRIGVPALAFKFAAAKGTAEHQKYLEWFRERYHAPSDDVAQPIDREAAARFTRFIADLTSRVANAAQRPRWKATSFFGRFARS